MISRICSFLIFNINKLIRKNNFSFRLSKKKVIQMNHASRRGITIETKKRRKFVTARSHPSCQEFPGDYGSKSSRAHKIQIARSSVWKKKKRAREMKKGGREREQSAVTRNRDFRVHANRNTFSFRLQTALEILRFAPSRLHQLSCPRDVRWAAACAWCISDSRCATLIMISLFMYL